VHTCTNTHAQTHTHAHTHTHTGTHTHTHKHTHTHTHTHKHTHTHTHTHTRTHTYTHTLTHTTSFATVASPFLSFELHSATPPSASRTGWRRLVRCLKVQVIFRKRANNYRALLRKMTYEDKASYDSTPPCSLSRCTSSEDESILSYNGRRLPWYIPCSGVATISRLLKIIGLFCKRALQKRRYSAKETYNFKEPTNRSHPIQVKLR